MVLVFGRGNLHGQPGPEDHLYREDRLSFADSVSAGRGVCPFFMISSADAVSAD